MAAVDGRLQNSQPWTLLPKPDPRPPIKYTNRKSSFWREGRVFMYPHAETVGTTAFLAPYNPYEFVKGRDNGTWIHQKDRIFVVISVEQWYCSVLPVATYNKQGVAKPGVNKSQHGIIYTGKDPIYISQQEAVCLGLLQPYSIRVVEDDRTTTLDPMSRINYAQVQPVQRNVAVKSIGMVHEDSLLHLMEQFKDVFMASLFRSGSMTAYRQPGPSAMMTDFTHEAKPPLHLASIHVNSMPGDHSLTLPGPQQYHQPPTFLSTPHSVSHEAIQSTAAQSQRAIGDGSPQLHSHSFDADTTDMPRRISYGRRRRGSRNPGPFHHHHHPDSRYGG